jgi:polysaccharide pyruvyl transferase WcaK-like protein
VSVGAGPIQRRLSRWFIKSALSFAAFRSYRDNSTKEYIRAIGFPADKDPVYPDLAFNLPESVIPRPDRRRTSRPVVGIGLMGYVGEPTPGGRRNTLDLVYLEKLALFVKWLLANEYDVRLLIGDLLYDSSAMDHFRTFLTKHVSPCSTGRIIDEPVSSVEHLLSQLASTDAVVATRFHNVLLALILQKPVISISFHHKCVSLMSEMGLSEYCQDIHRLDVERLIDQFCDLTNNTEKLKTLIQQRTEQCRRTLDEQYLTIFDDALSVTC